MLRARRHGRPRRAPRRASAGPARSEKPPPPRSRRPRPMPRPAARIDAVRAVLDPFVANLKVLAVALRDTNFVAHLVRARESELLAEATRRLKDITGGRFGFTSGFGVVNVASGEVRTPDTLSGGERFQAALALALGLVEIASRGGGKLDAVFVDEGFGSLDANALDTALETLGKVAGGGKVVALISHLRPVAEYVDTVLHVTRDDVARLADRRARLRRARAAPRRRHPLRPDSLRSPRSRVRTWGSTRGAGAMIAACAPRSATASASSSRSSPSATAATSSPRSARPAGSACSARWRSRPSSWRSSWTGSTSTSATSRTASTSSSRRSTRASSRAA